MAERERLLPRPTVREGDVLIGLTSSGPHTNGYTLIRRVFEDVPLDTVFPELGVPLADALLAPHRSYLGLLGPLLRAGDPRIKALAHLTGGGFVENIPRVLPAGIGMVVVAAPGDAAGLAAEFGEETHVIGELVPGAGRVEWA